MNFISLNESWCLNIYISIYDIIHISERKNSWEGKERANQMAQNTLRKKQVTVELGQRTEPKGKSTAQNSGDTAFHFQTTSLPPALQWTLWQLLLLCWWIPAGMKHRLCRRIFSSFLSDKQWKKWYKVQKRCARTERKPLLTLLPSHQNRHFC